VEIKSLWASKNKKTALNRLLTLPSLAGASGLTHVQARRLVLESLEYGVDELREFTMDEVLQDTHSLAELCETAIQAGEAFQTEVGAGLADAYETLLASGDSASAHYIISMVCGYQEAGTDLVRGFVEQLRDTERSGRFEQCAISATG